MMKSTVSSKGFNIRDNYYYPTKDTMISKIVIVVYKILLGKIKNKMINIMKKLLLVLILFLSFFSCSEEEIKEPILTAVTTNPITDITDNSAKSGGIITDENGNTITAKGVCWSTMENPTIEDNTTYDQSYSDSFTSVLTELMPDKIYYVRAFATDDKGITYGKQHMFTTLEKVFDGYVVLETQEEINDFGANGYSSITGLLQIKEGFGHRFSITDLKPLMSINSVASLFIMDNDALKSLEGLNNITSVVEDLTVYQNDALINIEGLNNLTSVKSEMIISANHALTNLNGLNNLTTVGKYLKIQENISLIDLDGFEKLNSVGKSLWIRDNKSLSNLKGLKNITSLEAEMIISGSTELTNLEGLNNFVSIMEIWIYDNTKLTNFCDISSLVKQNGVESYKVHNNKYNPTEQDIKDGKCSQ